MPVALHFFPFGLQKSGHRAPEAGIGDIMGRPCRFGRIAARQLVLALRAGIEEGRQSLGLGLNPLDNLNFDLAYLQHDELAATYQFSAGFRF